MAIASLVCGILSIIGPSVMYVRYFSFGLAILGIVFGVKGRKLNMLYGSGKGMATAGLVCGIIGLVFSVIDIIVTIYAMAVLGTITDSIIESFDDIFDGDINSYTEYYRLLR